MKLGTYLKTGTMISIVKSHLLNIPYHSFHVNCFPKQNLFSALFFKMAGRQSSGWEDLIGKNRYPHRCLLLHKISVLSTKTIHFNIVLDFLANEAPVNPFGIHSAIELAHTYARIDPFLFTLPSSVLRILLSK